MADKDNVEEILKPFHQRASEAEARLERLEAAAAIAGGSVDEGLSLRVKELTSELQHVKVQHTAEMQEVQKELQQLTGHNAKLQYRIMHLLRALEDPESKIPSK